MQKAHDSSYNDYWRNYPNISTPIVQDQLNRNETTVDTIDDRVVAMDTTKADQSDLLQDIKNVTFDSSTGTFTFTKQNNTTIVIDTDIEKIAINFDYDDDPESAHYQNLIITLDDGTVKYIDMSALITEYEFTDSSVIHFSITSGVISATIIDGSITADKLQPNFLADCVSAKEAAELAEDHAETAEESALAHQYTAEAWAKGTKNDVPVTPTDAQYHDNAYYWAQQARAIVGDKVDSFNGRIGTVVAEDGDYPSDYIVPETGAIPGQVPVVRNVGTGQDVKLRYVNEDLDIGLKPHIIVISETGSTVTLTKGTKVIYASETSPEHFEADVTEFGTWVIDSVLGGDDAQVSLVVDAVKIYTVDDSHWHADITVTYPTGGTCSCSKSGTTTLYATGSPYTFTVHESGTYTITAIANGETYTDTVEVTTSGQTESLTIPKGSTITPTDSVATLLSCAGIHDTSITSVSDLLADTTTLLAVINSTNAIDYLVRSKSFAGVGLVPAMTSTTTPSGEVIYSSYRGSGFESYKAFDGNETTIWQCYGIQAPQYIGYKFTDPVKVRKVDYRINGGRNTAGKFQGSNDGTNWTDLTEEISFNQSTTGWYSFPLTKNIDNYTYYRIYLTTIDTMDGSNRYTDFFEIQFYEQDADLVSDSTAMSYIGLNNYAANTLLADSDWLNAICNSTYFESVLNVKVPTMTSNTTPSGQAFADTELDATYAAWKAFDGSNSSLWSNKYSSSAYSTAYLGYKFTSAPTLKKAMIRPFYASSECRLKDYKIQGSNDGSTWTDLHSGTVPNASQDNNIIVSNNDSYMYYRIHAMSQSYAGQNIIQIAELQFYCREDV